MWGSRFFLFVVSLSVWGQSNFASLGGRVEDPQRRPVQQAQVRIKSTATGAVRSMLVNGEALYDFAGLAPGEYDLHVQAPGFAEQTRRLRLEVGQSMRLDLSLSLDLAKAKVDVVGFAEGEFGIGAGNGIGGVNAIARLNVSDAFADGFHDSGGVEAGSVGAREFWI